MSMHARTYAGALKLANHHQARGLAERISALMTQRQDMTAAAEAAAAAAAGAGGPMAGQYLQQQGQHEDGAAAPRQQHAFTPIPFAIKR